MRKPMISLEHVSRVFTTAERSFTALEDVSLHIATGELIAITGRSGSGKSTLLNMITGIDYPSSGTVTIQETALGSLTENQLARWRGQHVGIVFQFFQLIPTLTISENLLLAMEFVGVVPKARRADRVEELLSRVGIADHAHKMPQALSGGQQQRAAIARALANDPALIVADEPTGNLDSQTAEAIQQLLAELAQSGTTVVVVTHERETGIRFDRTIMLSDGKIVQDLQSIHP